MTGSSLGFEAYFVSLTYGVRVVGVEILCGLVDLSEIVRKAHGVPRSLNSFVCSDALDFRLPSDASVVYVDDTAWDRHAVEKLADKLARDLPSGAIVIHNVAHGYEGGAKSAARYRQLASLEIGTSWDARHVIMVHEVR